MKARGVAELRKEMENLQERFKRGVTEEERIALQQEHSRYQEKLLACRQWSLDEESTRERPNLTTKRKSLPNPGHLDLTPHKFLAVKQSLQLEQKLDSNQDSSASTTPPDDDSQEGSPTHFIGTPVPDFQPKTLQQQLLQQRMQPNKRTVQMQMPMSQVQAHQMYQQFQNMNIAQSGQMLNQPAIMSAGGDGNAVAMLQPTLPTGVSQGGNVAENLDIAASSLKRHPSLAHCNRSSRRPPCCCHQHFWKANRCSWKKPCFRSNTWP